MWMRLQCLESRKISLGPNCFSPPQKRGRKKNKKTLTWFVGKRSERAENSAPISLTWIHLPKKEKERERDSILSRWQRRWCLVRHANAVAHHQKKRILASSFFGGKCHVLWKCKCINVVTHILLQPSGKARAFSCSFQPFFFSKMELDKKKVEKKKGDFSIHWRGRKSRSRMRLALRLRNDLHFSPSGSWCCCCCWLPYHWSLPPLLFTSSPLFFTRIMIKKEKKRLSNSWIIRTPRNKGPSEKISSLSHSLSL